MIFGVRKIKTHATHQIWLAVISLNKKETQLIPINKYKLIKSKAKT